MKTVYFVRHGESESNVRTPGLRKRDSDVALTPRGREQSEFIARRAAHLRPEALISSPYERTRDTAALIASQTGIEIEYSELFTERRTPGRLAEMSTGDPQTDTYYRSWADTFFSEGVRVDDGENFEDLKVRGRRALQFLEARSESVILVVTHGFFLRMLIALVMFGDDLTPKEMRAVTGATRTHNTGISMFTYGSIPHLDIDSDVTRWRLQVFNDHAHLG